MAENRTTHTDEISDENLAGIVGGTGSKQPQATSWNQVGKKPTDPTANHIPTTTSDSSGVTQAQFNTGF